MRELRRWGDLELDCLVNILQRLGMDSLLLDVPFVCKSWYKATLNPSCWQHIDFFDFCNKPYNTPYSQFVLRFIHKYQVENFSIGGLIRLIVARGQSKSTSLVLPSACCYSDLNHVAQKCPELKSLRLPLEAGAFYFIIAVPVIIGKWTLLEELRIDFETADYFTEMVVDIGRNCKKLKSLAVFNGVVHKNESLAITKHLPKIKRLSLIFCFVEQKYLEIIICNCEDLEFFEVRMGKFERIWEEKRLRELGLHIETLHLEELR